MADAVNVVFPRKLVKEFITLYQNLPCLWDKHCISYKMKHKRHEAITKLTQLVQEYDPSATRVHVLRKIESLRACVRREHKRVQHSKEIAESEADIYTPHLWYYDLFSFMFQTDAMNEDYDKTKAHGSSPQPAAEDSEPDDPEDEALPDEYDASIMTIDDDYSSAAFSIANNMVEVPESTNGAAQSSSKRFLDEDKNRRHCTEVDDEYDAIGVNVAAKLRNLPGNMRILAEKLINDVLFQAQTNGLTNATFINTPLDERDSEPDDPEDEALPDDDDASIVAMDDNYSSAAFSIASNMVEVPESISGAAQTSSKRFLDEDKNKRHCTEVDDEYDAIGVNVAAKLRNLPGNMRILAEKLINDVLYQAQTNGLTNATFINTPDPFK